MIFHISIYKVFDAKIHKEVGTFPCLPDHIFGLES